MADDSESRGVRLSAADWAWLEQRARAQKWTLNYTLRVILWRARGRAGLPPDGRTERWKK